MTFQQKLQTSWYIWQGDLNAWFSINALLNQTGQLKKLINWARRKRYKEPQNFYRWQLNQVDMKLARYKRQNPKLYHLALFWKTAQEQIWPKKSFRRHKKSR